MTSCSSIRYPPLSYAGLVTIVDKNRDETPLREHLSAALEAADDETAKYHIREAYQKVIVEESR